MPGKTKRKYEGELVRFAKRLRRPLELVVETLKPGYTGNDLLQAFKDYYPFEWEEICERWKIYSEKDKFLKQKKGKTRYKPSKPEEYFFSLMKVKYLLSKGFREKHKQNYNEQLRVSKTKALRLKRDGRIKKRRQRIEMYTEDLQQVDPGFIDALIYAYHDRHNSTNDKMEIFKEIQKYDCEKSRQFFWKLNDSERNDQIRNLAFKHLQKSGHYVKLRKGFKGKKKTYQIERSTFKGTPQALAKKLQDDKSVQGLKHYDLFISHSSKDKSYVRQVVEEANAIGLNCYVDWTADNDFLKRSMVSEYTKEVLKVRMKQSKKLLYLSSDKSRSSQWVSFELDYYKNCLQREIRMIILDGEDVHDFKHITLKEMDQLLLRA